MIIMYHKLSVTTKQLFAPEIHRKTKTKKISQSGLAIPGNGVMGNVTSWTTAHGT